ncbi:MAG: hypothetical protein IPK82_23100 [Polyangiaceae bacterium]|nr:hypothetical protein [Polyangiaceae bacterium]
MSTRSRRRYLKRLLDAFRGANLATDGEHVFAFGVEHETFSKTDSRMKSRLARRYRNVKSLVSVTLDDFDNSGHNSGSSSSSSNSSIGDENHTSSNGSNSGFSSDAEQSNEDSKPTTKTLSDCVLTGANSFAPGTRAPSGWFSLCTVEQFVLRHAIARARPPAADEVALLARLFLQLVPVLPHAPPLTVESSTRTTLTMEQFATLKTTIDNLLLLNRQSNASTSATVCTEQRLWALLVQASDGDWLYVANPVDVPTTSKAMARLVESPFVQEEGESREEKGERTVQSRRSHSHARCKWRRACRIDQFVRSAYRKAFPELAVAINQGTGGGECADAERVCIAGEFYLRERVSRLPLAIE